MDRVHLKTTIAIALASVWFVMSPIPFASAGVCCVCAPKDLPASKTCVTGDFGTCADMVQNTKNPDLKNAQCDPAILSTTECAPKKPTDATPAGLCLSGPIADTAFSSKNAAAVVTTNVQSPVIPNLNTPIPGLAFSTVLTQQNGKINVPFLAQYISGVERYAIGLSVIAAAIMVMYGGFLYVIGSSIDNVQRGKTVIADALIGLAIVLGIYLILNTLNPDLVKLKTLEINVVKQDPWETGQFAYAQSYAQTVGGASDGTNPPTTVPSNAGDIAQKIIKSAKAVGADPCALLAICDHETGLKPNVWSGMQTGQPKDKATAFGVCQIALSNILRECPPQTDCSLFSSRARKLFPDFPPPYAGAQPTTDELNARRDWLMNNPEGNAYLAALVFKSSSLGRNELLGVASFGAGLGSMQVWQKAHGCSPTSGILIKNAASDPGGSLSASCIPHAVAIPTVGDEPKGCPQDKYDCADVKIDKGSQFVGHCPSNADQKCYAMVTDGFVQYVLRAYPRMVSQYQCDK